MTRTGRAVIAHDQEFTVQEFIVPDPAPGTLILRQELGGICGTDVHNWQNGFTAETFIGHENVGIIDALGAGLREDYLGNPVNEGDRVVFHPRNNGVAYGFRTLPQEDPPFSGGFSDYIYLAEPETCFVKVNAPAEVAVLAEPFAVGVHSVMRGNVQLGDTVIVQGSGAIGLLTLAAAKLSGAARCMVVGGPADRLALARKLGADEVFNIEEVPDPAERAKLVMDATPRGEGADVVFECAGFLPAIGEGLSYVKQDGTFVEVGHFVDVGTIQLNPNTQLLRRNLRLEAIWGSRFNHFVRGIALMERGDMPLADLVSHVLPLDRVKEGFLALDGSYRLGEETVVKIAVAAERKSSW